MKKILRYGLYALIALFAPLAFQSCNDAKDIVLITEDLPLIVSHLYMLTSIWWATLRLRVGTLTVLRS